MTAASATRAVPDPAVIIQHACTLTKWLLAAENRRLIEGKRVRARERAPPKCGRAHVRKSPCANEHMCE
jgi:hypothetical protein